MATKSDGTTVRVVVEYKFRVGDVKTARIIAENASKYGTTLGTDNYSIWEFSPDEVILEATAE